MDIPSLSAQEQQVLDTLLLDPKKRYQLLLMLEKELNEFDAWRAGEEKKEKSGAEDREKISLLRKFISNFHL